MIIDDAHLVRALRSRDLVSKETVERAYALQEKTGDSLYLTLLKHDLVDEIRLVRLASDILNVSFVNLETFQPKPKIVSLLPPLVALENQVLPLDVETSDDQRELILAMRDPIDVLAMDEVANHTGIDIRPLLAGPFALKDTLVKVYGKAVEDGVLEELFAELSHDENAQETDEPPSDEFARSRRESTDKIDAFAEFSSQLAESSAPPKESEAEKDESRKRSKREATPLGRIQVKQIAVPRSRSEDSEPQLGEPTVVLDETDAANPTAEEEDTARQPEDEAVMLDIDLEPVEVEPDPDGPVAASFLERLDAITGGLDNASRRRLRESSQSSLIEAVVLALFKNELLTVDELLEALEELE